MIRSLLALAIAWYAATRILPGAHQDGPSSVQVGPNRARIVIMSEYSARPEGGDQVCVVTVPTATLAWDIACRDRWPR